MFGQKKWVIDVIGGGGLVIALLVVFLFNIHLGSQPFVNTLDVEVIETKPSGGVSGNHLKLAVTQGERKYFGTGTDLWDDMGRLLRELGEGYDYTPITTSQIAQNPKMLDDYDVLFLTCAPNTGPEISGIIRDYVARGGTLYASDFRFDILKHRNAFEELVYHPHALKGAGGQTVTATVKNQSLREALGSDHIDLEFDLPAWRTAAFRSPPAEVLLEGRFRTTGGSYRTAPLLVRFPFGDGTVIFTSFHNEKINRGDATKLLQYLVFTLVTAEVEKMVNAKIQKGGFAPQKSNLLSTPKDDPKVSKTYNHESGKPLRFALGFRDAGAKLRFKIVSPKNKVYQWEGTATAIFDVPDAPKGEWTYEVTAVDLPYPNFPFTVTVGEKE